MHWIERHLLKQLSFSDSRRYTELKPDGVEGNLFQYHARLLEKRGLISRTEDGYALTSAGKIFVADLSQTKLMHPRKLPRAVVMIVCINAEGQHLLFRWRRQPYRGLVSLPFGRLLYDQSPTTMAAEQLLLKTGYQAQLDFIGQADIISGQYNQVADHLSASVFVATSPQQIVEPDGLTGEYFWGDPGTVEPASATAGFHEIVAWARQPSRSGLLEVCEESH